MRTPLLLFEALPSRLDRQSVMRTTLASRRQSKAPVHPRQFYAPTAHGSARGSSWRAANLRFIPVAGSGETSLVGWTRRPDQDVGSLPAVLAQVAQPVLTHLGELDLVAVGIDDRRDERGRAERSDGIAKLHAASFQVLGEGPQIEDPEGQAHRTGRRRLVARMDGEMHVAQLAAPVLGHVPVAFLGQRETENVAIELGEARCVPGGEQDRRQELDSLGVDIVPPPLR